mmetsp:Transcript_100025/g.283123  ORF Transcript_100025/g.283123 Transcript_100025/m.283123 type:complete len:301 (-) Transcript_100025:151-1053(-)
MGGALGGCGDAGATREYFAGKVVWVTGASAGLGEELCVALSGAAELHGLILSARRQNELERVKKRCLELNPNIIVEVLPLDLADIAGLQETAKQAPKFFGHIDVLINNGGVGFRGFGSTTPLEIDQRVMNINYFSSVVLTKSLLPSWLSARNGHVVHISSVQAFFGLPGRTAYAAAKHAAVGFYDSLRAEVAGRGVSVTTVCPGYIATGHGQAALHGEGVAQPEEQRKNAVAPSVLAPRVLAAVARRRPEMVPAPADAQMARLLRTLCPRLLFFLMARRVRKEEWLRQAAEGETPNKKED